MVAAVWGRDLLIVGCFAGRLGGRLMVAELVALHFLGWVAVVVLVIFVVVPIAAALVVGVESGVDE